MNVKKDSFEGSTKKKVLEKPNKMLEFNLYNQYQYKKITVITTESLIEIYPKNMGLIRKNGDSSRKSSRKVV